jgi:hypothetical protein
VLTPLLQRYKGQQNLKKMVLKLRLKLDTSDDSGSQGSGAPGDESDDQPAESVSPQASEAESPKLLGKRKNLGNLCASFLHAD